MHSIGAAPRWTWRTGTGCWRGRGGCGRCTARTGPKKKGKIISILQRSYIHYSFIVIVGCTARPCFLIVDVIFIVRPSRLTLSCLITHIKNKVVGTIWQTDLLRLNSGKVPKREHTPPSSGLLAIKAQLDPPLYGHWRCRRALSGACLVTEVVTSFN